MTLLTDFGITDTYVAQMKAVLYGLAPSCLIVDISHEIPAQNIYAGARALAETALLFPTGTIHVAVVDPGVGTQRRLIAAKLRGHLFVMPDNGLLSLLVKDFSLEAAVELTERKFWRSPVSHTFHGRDILAPVAAYLAKGGTLLELGQPIHNLANLMEPCWKRIEGGVLGTISAIDHFGNAITNLPNSLFKDFSFECPVLTWINDRCLEWRWCAAYGFAPPNTAIALIGSNGHLELAVNCGSAALEFRLQVGDAIIVYC